jgi:hypothetical protein
MAITSFQEWRKKEEKKQEKAKSSKGSVGGALLDAFKKSFLVPTSVSGTIRENPLLKETFTKFLSGVEQIPEFKPEQFLPKTPETVKTLFPILRAPELAGKATEFFAGQPIRAAATGAKNIIQKPIPLKEFTKPSSYAGGPAGK